jgi:hypothetical protein
MGIRVVPISIIAFSKAGLELVGLLGPKVGDVLSFIGQIGVIQIHQQHDHIDDVSTHLNDRHLGNKALCQLSHYFSFAPSVVIDQPGIPVLGIDVHTTPQWSKLIHL